MPNLITIGAATCRTGCTSDHLHRRSEVIRQFVDTVLSCSRLQSKASNGMSVRARNKRKLTETPQLHGLLSPSLLQQKAAFVNGPLFVQLKGIRFNCGLERLVAEKKSARPHEYRAHVSHTIVVGPACSGH